MRFFAVALLLLLSGCLSVGPAPAERIQGEWQSMIAGISVVTSYAEGSVSVDGYVPLPYIIESNELMINDDPNTLRVVSFPDANTMLQLDPITGTEHTYQRIAP